MYAFYLGNLRLPVAPAKMEIKINNQNKTVTLINEGEINILKTAGLTEISFTAYIPGVRYPWAVYDGVPFRAPLYFLDKLEKLKISLQAFDFVVARTWDNGLDAEFRTNMKVSLESYTIEEAAGNGKDFEVEIKLKQYKTFGTKTITIKKETATASTTTKRAEPAAAAKTYTIVSGDTLWGIAKRTLGSGEKWKTLYDLNRDVIEAAAKKYGKASSSTGHWIYPGTVLKISG